MQQAVAVDAATASPSISSTPTDTGCPFVIATVLISSVPCWVGRTFRSGSPDPSDRSRDGRAPIARDRDAAS